MDSGLQVELQEDAIGSAEQNCGEYYSLAYVSDEVK